MKKYKQHIEQYILANQNHGVISKLKSNLSITVAEVTTLEQLIFDGKERGTKSDYQNIYGKQSLGEVVRKTVGVDRMAANEAFAEFLMRGNLNANQIRCIAHIVDHIVEHGMVDQRALHEPPFSSVHDMGIFGIFESDQIVTIMRIINGINYNAQV